MSIPSRYLSAAAAALLAAVLTLTAPGRSLAAGRALPVPGVTIYPGDTINEGMLVDKQYSANVIIRVPIIDSREGLVGRVARRTLLPGYPVPTNAIRDPYLVTQGKIAIIAFRSGGLTITGQVIALQSGSAGDMVSVRNVDSGLTIRGVIEPDGTVRVGAP